MSVSKNQIKFITSLQQKKYRMKEGLFVVEGVKVVGEFILSNFSLHSLYCTEEVLKKYQNEAPVVVTEQELKKISTLKSPNKVIAIFRIPEQNKIADIGLKVLLDDVNDPGNLGTIIRLCDWFGVKELICSRATVDCYNSKVVQSTMGSLTRVQVNYIDIEAYLDETDLPCFVTDMDGANIYDSELPESGVIIMGNEANGVRLSIQEKASKKISIPRFGVLKATESLNVATATAIVLSEFRRTIGK